MRLTDYMQRQEDLAGEAARKAIRKVWGDPGSKVTRKTAAFVWSSGKGRLVVATVYHDGIIGTRLLGSRTEYYTLLADIHRNAVAGVAAAKRAAKKKGYGRK
jgi:hypothetical protein